MVAEMWEQDVHTRCSNGLGVVTGLGVSSTGTKHACIGNRNASIRCGQNYATAGHGAMLHRQGRQAEQVGPWATGSS